MREIEVRSKIPLLVGASWAKIADPAVVLVVGWVALERHSESEWYQQICSKSGCTPKSVRFTPRSVRLLQWEWLLGGTGAVFEVQPKIRLLVGTTAAKTADPAMVMVVGWVALECHSESDTGWSYKYVGYK